MPLLTSIIDLDSVHTVAKSTFDPQNQAAAVEALAHTIIDLDGIVAIPVVRSVGIDEYELISGDLAYFAYLKARELSDKLPDRLSVFIANKKTDAAISRQLESLQLIQQTAAATFHPDQLGGSDTNDSSLRLNNLASRVDKGFERTSGAFEQLKHELLSAIDQKLPQPLPALDAFNRILEPEVAHQIQHRLAFLGTKKAQKIVARLQSVKQQNPDNIFRNFAEVLGALEKGQLSPAKMLEVIDRWHG
jgi:signal transduction histidine kinase